eukprot:TRINITY_DN7268_c0_g1_i2.p1 TRINITY_DN7268_c0_g1~~TRINITY_DN7268_c0_g1_i2.p1  ORF type:complete len:281 (-),score=24.82 TRINITY_DN7268_c0_g1_i2:111-953(-)
MQSEYRIYYERIRQLESYTPLRAEVSKKIKPPPSTERVIILPHYDDAITYTYAPEDLKKFRGKIDPKLLRDTVRTINNVVNGIWLRSKTEEYSNHSSFIKKLAYLVLLVIFVAMVLLGVNVYGSAQGESDLLTTLFIIFVFFATVIAVGAPLISFFWPGKLVHYGRTAESKIQGYIRRQNENLFFRLELEWRLGPGAYWLELWDLKIRDARPVHVTPQGKKGGMQQRFIFKSDWTDKNELGLSGTCMYVNYCKFKPYIFTFFVVVGSSCMCVLTRDHVDC